MAIVKPAAAADDDLIVLAWGTKAPLERARAVSTRLWRITRGAIAVLDCTTGGEPYHRLLVRADARLQCLTARAHSDTLDVDPRWTQLLADAAGLNAGESTAGAVAR